MLTTCQARFKSSDCLFKEETRKWKQTCDLGYATDTFSSVSQAGWVFIPSPSTHLCQWQSQQSALWELPISIPDKSNWGTVSDWSSSSTRASEPSERDVGKSKGTSVLGFESLAGRERGMRKPQNIPQHSLFSLSICSSSENVREDKKTVISVVFNQLKCKPVGELDVSVPVRIAD